MEPAAFEKQARVWVKCKFPPRIRIEADKANKSSWTDWKLFGASLGTVQNQHSKLKWHLGSVRWNNYWTKSDWEWIRQHSSSLLGIFTGIEHWSQSNQ